MLLQLGGLLLSFASYSILAVTGVLPPSQAPALLGLITHILNNEKADSETIYRATVALGNLLSSNAAGSLSVGEVQNGTALVSTAARQLNEKRMTDLAAEITSLSA